MRIAPISHRSCSWTCHLFHHTHADTPPPPPPPPTHAHFRRVSPCRLPRSSRVAALFSRGSMVRLTPIPTPLARVCLKTHAPFNPLDVACGYCPIHACTLCPFHYVSCPWMAKSTRIDTVTLVSTCSFLCLSKLHNLTQCSCSFDTVVTFVLSLCCQCICGCPLRVRAANERVIVCSPKHPQRCCLMNANEMRAHVIMTTCVSLNGMK
jgi:hypothetical protein